MEVTKYSQELKRQKWILRLVSLLELTPLLQKLVLNMLSHVLVGFSNEPEAYRHFQPRAHRHLEQFKVSGFIGLSQLEMVLCILNNAVALRRMSIEPRVTHMILSLDTEGSLSLI